MTSGERDALSFSQAVAAADAEKSHDHIYHYLRCPKCGLPGDKKSVGHATVCKDSHIYGAYKAICNHCSHEFVAYYDFSNAPGYLGFLALAKMLAGATYSPDIPMIVWRGGDPPIIPGAKSLDQDLKKFFDR